MVHIEHRPIPKRDLNANSEYTPTDPTKFEFRIAGGGPKRHAGWVEGWMQVILDRLDRVRTRRRGPNKHRPLVVVVVSATKLHVLIADGHGLRQHARGVDNWSAGHIGSGTAVGAAAFVLCRIGIST